MIMMQNETRKSKENKYTGKNKKVTSTHDSKVSVSLLLIINITL